MPSRKSQSTSAAQQDAVALLKADHAEVKKMFAEFEKAKKQDDEDTKREIVAQVCEALTVHATIEEEIFYPAFRETKGMEDLLDEAEVEHGSARMLVAAARVDAEPGDELYDAKVKVLAEYVEHHVKEEEGELFRRRRSPRSTSASSARCSQNARGSLWRKREASSSEDSRKAPWRADERPLRSKGVGDQPPLF